MKVDDYRLLATLSEAKTLRKAAEKLYISQPAVSQRLKSIEDEWGVQIFIRTKKHYIRQASERIIAHAKKVVDEERLVKRYIQANEGEIEGKISIGVSSLIGIRFYRIFLQNI